MEQIPSVGRIVRYQSFGTPKGEYLPKPIAAIITQVNQDGSVGLCIFNPTGLFFNIAVRQGLELQPDGSVSEVPTPGCWTWPPRV